MHSLTFSIEVHGVVKSFCKIIVAMRMRFDRNQNEIGTDAAVVGAAAAPCAAASRYYRFFPFLFFLWGPRRGPLGRFLGSAWKAFGSTLGSKKTVKQYDVLFKFELQVLRFENDKFDHVNYAHIPSRREAP